MWVIKSTRLNDFLGDNGLFPDYELFGAAYYMTSAELRELIDRYIIIYECFPNKGWF